MIEVAELIKDSSLGGNYFATDAYVQGDYEFGLIENRQGSRLLALPEVLLKAIHTSLENEVGPAAGLVLFNCGRWWGKNFYRRFSEELSNYYGKPIAQMEMVELLQCLKQCWKSHGWGTMDLDMDYYQQGFLVVKVWNSAFAETATSGDTPKCFLEAGIFSVFFSQITGRNLHCVQTSCESMGAECNHFVVGLIDRLKPVEDWLKADQDHSQIMNRLAVAQE
ncbi:putative hydrocarbon binding protein (contains V4R domain) [Xenococcus sp. PCC 7305]|uniref:V4R domain-containing protein n=1 Tax=Xenococcus sp. PCC 7305 TaxID=102125 RepID=UPI0002AC1EE3|nr:V4R domain-containing protein [Xenococcus sp. PCC 7305]ELS00379.1 putative hydrocarbon binding protein (contains V4R domain) [Xenococcus sp. PCC 7305]